MLLICSVLFPITWICLICKRYYTETLTKELGLDNCSTPTGHPTYTSCQRSSEDIVNTYDTFMKPLSIELYDDDNRLRCLYWTPKLPKSPAKHRVIAGSSRRLFFFIDRNHHLYRLMLKKKINVYKKCY